MSAAGSPARTRSCPVAPERGMRLGNPCKGLLMPATGNVRRRKWWVRLVKLWRLANLLSFLRRTLSIALRPSQRCRNKIGEVARVAQRISAPASPEGGCVTSMIFLSTSYRANPIKGGIDAPTSSCLALRPRAGQATANRPGRGRVACDDRAESAFTPTPALLRTSWHFSSGP